jgi:hypothetical protein
MHPSSSIFHTPHQLPTAGPTCQPLSTSFSIFSTPSAHLPACLIHSAGTSPLLRPLAPPRCAIFGGTLRRASACRRPQPPRRRPWIYRRVAWTASPTDPPPAPSSAGLRVVAGAGESCRSCASSLPASYSYTTADGCARVGSLGSSTTADDRAHSRAEAVLGAWGGGA